MTMVVSSPSSRKTEACHTYTDATSLGQKSTTVCECQNVPSEGPRQRVSITSNSPRVMFVTQLPHTDVNTVPGIQGKSNLRYL